MSFFLPTFTCIYAKWLLYLLLVVPDESVTIKVVCLDHAKGLVWELVEEGNSNSAFAAWKTMRRLKSASVFNVEEGCT